MKQRSTRLVFSIAILCANFSTGQTIQSGTLTVPPQLKLVTTLTPQSAGAPDFGINSGDPRFMYIGEQNGSVRILDFNQPNPLLGTSFLNIDSILGADTNGNRVLVDDTNTGERGLLGAAFHPGFSNPASPGFRKFYTFTSETLASSNQITDFRHETEDATGNSNSGDPVQVGIPNGYNCQSVIREWTVNAPDANGVMTVDTTPASRRVVMRIAKPGRFHNGGGITFGGDGYMYIPLGDGGGGPSNGGNDGGNNSLNNGHTNPGNPDSPGAWTGQGNAQDRLNPYGKILRIKPTTDADANTNPSGNGQYRVPKSNPFTLDTNPSNPAAFVDEIYAYGFRNPFRISFDKANPNKLYAADVGQDRNTFSREELDLITSGGGDYGWVAKSGDQANTNETSYSTSIPLTDPIKEYPTTQLGSGGLAIIGGFVYRGVLVPELNGKYVFADLDKGDGTGGRLLYADLTNAALNVMDINTTGAVVKPNGQNIHGVAQDANGEIYFLFGNGQVMELVPEPSSAAIGAIGALIFAARRRKR
jgi:glucose/arabinose dehydrogenase